MRLFGSHARGTAIDEGSDRDYMAIVSKESIRWGERDVSSDTMLARLRDALARQNPEATIVRDGQAIRIRSATGDADVVVAIFDGPAPNSGHPVYRIPDGQGGWMRTSPDAYQKYLKDADREAGGQLRSTVKGLKVFKRRTERPLPIKSLYLELVVAHSGAAVGIKSKEQALVHAFRALHESGCRDIADPTGVGDPIKATRTAAQREAVRGAVEVALHRAERAMAARAAGNHKEAGRLWGLIYGGSRP